MTKVLKFVGLTLGIAVVGFVIFSFWFLYGRVIRNEIWPRRYYYTVSADLSIGGEHITMSGTTECRWVQMPRPLPLVTDTSHYRMIGGPVGKRLPDGSALLIWVGNLCGGHRNFSGTRFDQSSETLFDQNSNAEDPKLARLNLSGKMKWYVAHLDDATAPKRIEVYIGPDYFRLPQADIRLHHVEIRMTPSGYRTDVDAEIPWLRDEGSLFKSSDTQPVTYRSYFARIIPPSVWKNDEVLSSILKKITEPTNRVRELARSQGIKSLSLLGATIEVVPLRHENGKLVLSTSDLARGWAFTLLPGEARSRLESCGGALQDFLYRRMPLWLDRRFLVPDAASSSVTFDPVTGIVIMPGQMCIQNNYAFRALD